MHVCFHPPPSHPVKPDKGVCWSFHLLVWRGACLQQKAKWYIDAMITAVATALYCLTAFKIDGMIDAETSSTFWGCNVVNTAAFPIDCIYSHEPRSFLEIIYNHPLFPTSVIFRSYCRATANTFFLKKRSSAYRTRCILCKPFINARNVERMLANWKLLQLLIYLILTKTHSTLVILV